MVGHGQLGKEHIRSNVDGVFNVKGKTAFLGKNFPHVSFSFPHVSISFPQALYPDGRGTSRPRQCGMETNLNFVVYWSLLPPL